MRRRLWTAPRLAALSATVAGLVGSVAVAGVDAGPERPVGEPAAILKTPKFSFGLWGDLPYDAEQEARVPALTRSMNEAHLAFSVFDGDLKSGGTPCTDDVYRKAIDRFSAFDDPVVYVPGDNEWTDCHRVTNGGYNNLERLAHLRRVMFAGPESFGRRTLLLEPQSAEYPENRRWTYGDVVFVTLNVPGSNNNKVNGPAECSTGSVRTPADCDADNAEYTARDTANRQWLHEAFELARSRDAAAVMVVMQGDPGFDLPETAVNERTLPAFDGYTALLGALVDEARAFGGQVALVHGDTHYFTVDKPLVDQAHVLENLTRVETFGSPNVHWVKAKVDPRNPNVFTFEPRIVPAP